MTPEDIARAAEIAGRIEDPELPPLTIAELGVLRSVGADSSGRIVARITPTYSGCPANVVIALAIEAALREAGFEDATVKTELAPAWSSTDITASGRRRLADMGIAPPPAHIDPGASAQIACPRCGAENTSEISYFGATACKSLWRCNGCREPFEAFKAI